MFNRLDAGLLKDAASLLALALFTALIFTLSSAA
ncbi:hypothetical protein MNBD_ALPHA09-666 [hydrothermal vent metagenome]|uniref:Uncharacterized protein n=1 Tax=hydrothermal vent metagenome TaxID=652676 RepID=A0A3B0U363_9ZZZZ